MAAKPMHAVAALPVPASPPDTFEHAASHPLADPVRHIWAFRYDGPVKAYDVRTCSYCTCIATLRCHKTPAQHGSDSSSCPECQLAARAATGKTTLCPNHCGLFEAIDYHQSEHGSVDAASFNAFRELAKAYVASLGKVSNIQVYACADQLLPDAPFAELDMSWKVTR